MRSSALVLVLIGGLCAAVYDARSARAKLDLIETGRVPRGIRITFTTTELNAWIRDEAKIKVPEGIRNLRLVPGNGMATGYADIDFVRLRQASTGESPGWLMKNLFSGERPVKVVARFQSQGGRGRVDVETVEVSGIVIEGRALEFAIEAFVLPAFPYATVSEWFHLQYGVDHFTVSPAGLSVFMAK